MRAKEKRLADALRSNLKRRKDLAREKITASPTSEHHAPPSEKPNTEDTP